MLRLIIVVGANFAGATALRAQANDKSLSQCASIQADAARLRCFDASAKRKRDSSVTAATKAKAHVLGKWRADRSEITADSQMNERVAQPCREGIRDALGVPMSRLHFTEETTYGVLPQQSTVTQFIAVSIGPRRAAAPQSHYRCALSENAAGRLERSLTVVR